MFYFLSEVSVTFGQPLFQSNPLSQSMKSLN